MASEDGQPRLPDELLDSVRRHADGGEVAVYSLCVPITFYPEWPEDPAARVDMIDNVLMQMPQDLIGEEARAAVCDRAAHVYGAVE